MLMGVLRWVKAEVLTGLSHNEIDEPEYES